MISVYKIINDKINKFHKEKIKKEIVAICKGKDFDYDKKKNRIIKIIFDYIGIALGTAIIAIGVSLFLVPNELSTGGFAGIATITYYYWHISVGTTMILLNLPLFIVAYIKIGKKFIIRTIYGTITLSLFIDFFDKFRELTSDRFLACIYGGILVGIGTAIVLKLKSTTGGSDLFSYIIKEHKPKYRTSNLILLLDFIIIILDVIAFKEIEVGLYSTIAIYLMGKMIDIIFEGTNFAKALLIISPKYLEISTKVGKEISRGSTGIYSKGMYTNEEKMMLLCVGSRNEAYRIQNIAKEIDDNAFIVIVNAREVLGKGFK